MGQSARSSARPELEGLEQMARLEALKSVEGDSTILAALHLAHPGRETPQAQEPAGPEHLAISGQPHEVV